MCFCGRTAEAHGTSTASVFENRQYVNVSQLLTRACAVMKDEMTAEDPVMAATLSIETKCPTKIICCRYSERNHYTKKCQG